MAQVPAVRNVRGSHAGKGLTPMFFSTGQQSMNRHPQSGSDCPTQAEGTAFLKYLLMFLKVNKEKGSIHLPRMCWSFLVYMPTAESYRRQMLLFLLHEKVFLTRTNRKIGHGLVGVAWGLPVIDTKGEMCRMRRRKLDCGNF